MHPVALLYYPGEKLPFAPVRREHTGASMTIKKTAAIVDTHASRGFFKGLTALLSTSIVSKINPFDKHGYAHKIIHKTYVLTKNTYYIATGRTRLMGEKT